MSKFSTTKKAAVSSPVTSVQDWADSVTHQGGEGFSRDAKSELFLLAVTNMVSEKTFYEDGKSRDSRFEQLTHQVTKEDPGWVARFVPFLRGTMNMRSASLVMALEYVKAGGPNGRTVVSSAIQRADEPAEAIGYWLGKYGKHIPKPVKRGVADAAVRLYTEWNALKYDGDKGIRMADVLELTHPKAKAPWQDTLFKYLIDKRHNRPELNIEGLESIRARAALDAVPAEMRRAHLAGGFPEGTTWEWASSWLGGKLDGAFWDAMIPNMGIFALVRNLRNFDDAGISVESTLLVKAKLTDAEVIAKSRMFPLRFYAAHKEVATTRWSESLDAAIEFSLQNIPSLGGRTLVLVDMSGSMDDKMSDRSKLKRNEAAAIFGAAIAMRAEKAELVVFGSESSEIPYRKVGSVLRLAGELTRNLGGTDTWGALQRHLKPEHNRVIIITDEQAGSYGYGYSGAAAVGDNRRLYTFNLAGYSKGHSASGSGNTHTFGGLTDSAFVALSLLERGKDAEWPF